MSKGRIFPDEFKAKVALEALKGQKTIPEIASEYQVHPTQINVWRTQLKENMASIFVKPDNKLIKEQEGTIEQLPKTRDTLTFLWTPILFRLKIFNWNI